MYEEESQMPDVIEMQDEDGNVQPMEVLDYFFYNGEEYAVLTAYEEDDTDAEVAAADTVEETASSAFDDVQAMEDEDDQLPADEITCFIMKVIATTGEDGEELEEFVPVEDPALEKKLIEIATTKVNSDSSTDD